MSQEPDWFWEEINKLTHIQCLLNAEIVKICTLKTSGEFDKLDPAAKELLCDHFEYFKRHAKFMIQLINMEVKNDKPAT